MTRRSLCFLVLLALTYPCASSAAQDVDRVRALYVAAAYEEALAAMPLVNGGTVNTELEQYRALCLLALGREPEAVTAIERLVRDHPTFVPPAGETSPRMTALFSAARAKLIPEIARATYLEAKTAYEARDHKAALAAFRRTIDLIDSLSEMEMGSMADLRLLASGFVDLSTERRPEPSSPPAVAALKDPAKEPPGKGSAEVKPESAGVFAGPVAINEQLPPWRPPDMIAARMEYVGLLRISIRADGSVEEATIIKGSHPAYDVAAVRAAKEWTYKPATSGGQPVATQKDIQIRLVPR